MKNLYTFTLNRDGMSITVKNDVKITSKRHRFPNMIVCRTTASRELYTLNHGGGIPVDSLEKFIIQYDTRYDVIGEAIKPITSIRYMILSEDEDLGAEYKLNTIKEMWKCFLDNATKRQQAIVDDLKIIRDKIFSHLE